jgi:hypothetical protein
LKYSGLFACDETFSGFIGRFGFTGAAGTNSSENTMMFNEFV